MKFIQMVVQTLLSKLVRITTTGRYLPVVDGLRFVAIMPVLMQHLSERLQRYSPINWHSPLEQSQAAFFASRGTIGVFLFFAISGFILCLPFAQAHLRGDSPPRLSKYLWRRVTRLEPPYIFWMSVFFIMLLLRGGEWSTLFPHWGASIFYLHNIAYATYSPINPVAWSLEIEIQFYLLAPILAKLFFSIPHAQQRRWLLFASIFGFISLQHLLGWQHFPYKLTLLGQLQHFLTGFLLADLYLCDWQGRPLRSYWIWDVAAALALLAMCLSWSEEYGKSLVFAVSLLCLLIATFRGRWFPRFLAYPWVAAIGGMCYTIYLIHLPLMEAVVPWSSRLYWGRSFEANLLLQALLVLPVVLAVSIVAFLALEKPFMDKEWITRLKRQIGQLAFAQRWKR